jgi:hypothetical protein
MGFIDRSPDNAVICHLMGALVFLLKNRKAFSLFSFWTDGFSSMSSTCCKLYHSTRWALQKRRLSFTKNKWLILTSPLTIGTSVKFLSFYAFCKSTLNASTQMIKKYGIGNPPSECLWLVRLSCMVHRWSKWSRSLTDYTPSLSVSTEYQTLSFAKPPPGNTFPLTFPFKRVLIACNI